jgi:AraC-like DNA-binding protein/mannose-6-phosphate isomerase-like protein (cupin superfamily)
MGRVWKPREITIKADAGGWRFLPEWWIRVPPQPWARESNLHNHLELNYVFEGEGRLEVAGRRHPLRPGDCYCAPPREEHVIGSLPGRPLGVYCVALNLLPGQPAPSEERARVRDWLRASDRIVTDTPARDLGRLFDAIQSCVEGAWRATAPAANGLLRALLLRLADRAAQGGAPDQPDGRSGLWVETGGPGDLVARAATFLIREMQREPRIMEIAGHLRVSVRRLQRAFTAAGFNYRTYLRDIRLQAASWALVSTDRPVGLIAQEAGYSKQSNFTDTFRRRFGATPGRYRSAGAAGTKG